MRHHIIVKFTPEVTDKIALAQEVRELFAGVLNVPGVWGVSVHPNVIDRPNRYDLMIVTHMDRDALTAYDACDVHHTWKDKYGHLIAQKTIFDCDD